MKYNRVINQNFNIFEYILWFHKKLLKKTDQSKIMDIYSQKTSLEMTILWILREWYEKNVLAIAENVDV
jgi:hypothetical protein